MTTPWRPHSQGRDLQFFQQHGALLVQIEISKHICPVFAVTETAAFLTAVETLSAFAG
jgi:hypothetical protein